jgi:hypothetical protein
MPIETIERKIQASLVVQYWLDWLSDDQVDPRQRILAAFSSQEFPPHILHHFACDCIEYTLKNHQELGAFISPGVWKLLRVKRDWIEGKISNSALTELKHQYLNNQLIPLQNPDRQIVQMLLWSMSSKASTAARYATYFEIYPHERVWQCSRLYHILLEYSTQCHILLSLLKQRKQCLDPQLLKWREFYEMSLFD